MIHKDEILVFKGTEDNKSRRIMLALEDQNLDSPKIFVRELNDIVDKNRFVYVNQIHSIGERLEKDTEESIIQRYLPENKWEYTADLFRKNNPSYLKKKKTNVMKTTHSPIKKRRILLINESTGERKDFDSTNGAAAFLGVNFSTIQKAAIYNGVSHGWRVYEDPETIRLHIEDLKQQLKTLKKLGVE